MSHLVRNASGWLLTAACWALAVDIRAIATFAQEVADAGSPPLTFRRIFVPDGEENQWPVGTERYLAVDPAEFEKLYRAATQPRDGRQAPPQAQLIAAQYDARLNQESLVGAGTWKFRAAHDPSVVHLRSCSLALANARWTAGYGQASSAPEEQSPTTMPAETVKGADNGGDSASSSAKPADATVPTAARLGTLPSGELICLVDHDGQLTFNFQLKSQQESSGTHRFELELPRALTTTLLIDLPLDVSPAIEPGTVTAEGAAEGGLRRWRIETGSVERATLRIAPLAVLAERERLSLVRQTLHYEVSSGGLEVVAEYDLDVHYQPLQRIEFVVEPGLHLAAALYGDVPLDWSVLSGTDAAGSRLAIELPEPILGGGRKLRLSARGEVVRGEPWKLPGIRPEGLFWQEGRATVHVGSPLVVSQLRTARCRQTATAALPAPLSGESFEVQFFDPQAAMEIVVDRRVETIAISSGIRVDVAPHSMSAHVEAELTALQGEWLELIAFVGEGWNITSIESEPAEALAEWSSDEQEGNRDRLRMRLSETLAGDKKLRLKLKAESLRPALQTALKSRDFVPAIFQGAVRTTEFIGIAAAAGTGLRLAGDAHLKRADSGRAPPEIAALFQNPPPSLVFLNDESAELLEVVPVATPARYSADTRVECVATSDGVYQIARVTCRPEAERIAKVYVRFAVDQSDEPRWRWRSDSETALTASPLSAEQISALSWPLGGEVWEIRLPQPQSAAFELSVERFVAWSGDFATNLPSLPESSYESGQIAVRTARNVPVELVTQLRALPAASADHSGGTSRGTFRYDPLIDADPASPPALILKRSADAAARPPVTIWNSQLHSRYDASGAVLHGMLLHVQNDGARLLRIHIPDHCELRDLWIDGVRTGRTLAGDDLLVPLPEQPRFLTVGLLCREQLSPFGNLQSFVPPSMDVEPSAPLDHVWYVALPAGYQMTSVSGSAAWSGSAQPGLAERLLGPLSPPTGQQEVEAAAKSRGIAPRTLSTHGPWKEAPPEILGLVQSSPRSALEIRLMTPSEVTAHVAYAPWRNFLAWCFGLAALAAQLGVSPNGRWSLVGLLVVTTAALVAPASWTLFTGAVWLGWVSGTMLRWLVPRPRRSHPGPEHEDDSTAFAVTASTAQWMVLLVALLAAAPAHGEQPAVPKGREDYRVFIPVDESGKPTSNSYQVPEELLFRLQQAAQSAARKPQGYVWTSARYDAALLRDARTQSIEFERLNQTFQFDVLSAPTQIEIPFAEDVANLLPGSVKLDGRSLPVAASTDRRSIVISVNETGDHRLELALRPRVQTVGDLRRVDLPIPRVVDASLSVALPEGAPPVEIQHAAGPTEVDDDRGRMRVALGGADQLTIEWAESAAGNDEAVEVQELLWLNVRPGSVAVDVQLKYQLDGRPRTARIALDPRLRLLSTGAGNSGKAPRIVDAPSHQLEIDAVPDASGTATVAASFLLTGTSGVGKLRLPRIEPVGGRVTKRWLALSIDPGLEFVEEGVAELSPVAVPDFQSAWGPAAPVPLVAHQVPSSDVAWSLATQPRETRSEASTDLAVVVGAFRALVRFEAQIATTSGYVFQHQLSVPTGFMTESVSVLADNTERVARWSQHGSNSLVVFLTGPTSGDHRLRIDGWLPVPVDGRMPLPNFRFSEVAIKDADVFLYRRPSVLLTLEEAVGLESVRELSYSLDPAALPAVLHDRFRVKAAETATGTLVVVPNRPQVAATEVVTLSRGSSGWHAEYVCDLDAVSGVLDEIQLEASPEWGPSWSLEPNIAIASVDSADAASRRLLITPASGISGRLRISVRAAIRNSAGTSLKAPSIELVGASAKQRYLVVPTRVGEARIDWQTRGMEPAKLPAELAITAARETAVYRIVGERGEAMLDRVDSESRSPSVRLADYSVAWTAWGPTEGLAIFDVDPAETLACPLSIPPGCEVLQVFVDGVPAGVHEKGKNRWEVRTGPSRSPVRIQTLFRAPNPLATGDKQARILAPQLGDLPVRQTLWRAHADAELTVPGSPARQISTIEHALVRLRSVVGLIDVLGSHNQEEATDETARSFRPWARRLRSARHDVEAQMASGSAGEIDSARGELAAIEQEQERLATRLGATEVLQQVSAEPLGLDQPGQLWETLARSHDPPATFFFPGEKSELACDVRYRGALIPLVRWFLPALLSSLAAIVIFARRLPARSNAALSLASWLLVAILGAMIWAEGAIISFGLLLLLSAAVGLMVVLVQSRHAWEAPLAIPAVEPLPTAG